MFTVIVQRPGLTALEFTPETDSVRFSTAAVGGFGACSFRIPGIRWFSRVPLLAKVQVRWGTALLWEGRVEDVVMNAIPENTCNVVCFGFRRLLEETSIKRVWSLRSINWQPAIAASGLATVNGVTPVLAAGTTIITVGQFDQSDLTKVGIKVSTGGSNTSPEANWAIFVAPSGITFVKSYFQFDTTAGGSWAFIEDSTNGTSWTKVFESSSAGSSSATHSASASRVLFGSMAQSSPGGPDGSFWDIRLLCTSVDESASGGIYGSSILRDLLALVPGLGVGTIETASDFAIPALGRMARDSALSVVEEVAAYYSREWAVREDAIFDWKTPNLDEPHWIVQLADLQALNLEASVDGATKSVYLLYEDAASGVPGEASATSTDARNPYVKLGMTRDEVLQAPVVMTSLSAAQIASKLVRDRGSNPAIRGRAVLAATALVQHAQRGAMPAFAIRGGDNIVIPDLPKDDYLRPGRDGQTLFHIRGADTDMEKGTVTLELEGYSRRSDVLLARIGAVTRAIAG